MASLFAAHLAASAADPYLGDGELSARLELQRWYINRARYAPEREADRLGLYNADPGGHPDYDVCEDSAGTNDFGDSPAVWARWTNSLPPLAPEMRLNTAAANHAKDMAETGVFSHYSPSSNYYPQGSSPMQRHVAEGYTNQIVGYYENIAMGWRGSTGGYPPWGRTPESVCTSLFIDASADSRGHRQAILNSNANEIGLGHCRTNKYEAPYYKTYDYDVQDFGRRAGWSFFTGTIFHDDDGDGFYDEGEGRPGVEIHLLYGTNEAPWYDLSTDSGNFAVPLTGIPAGTVVTVALANVSGSNLTLSVPLGYSVIGELPLPDGETRRLGTFVQPAQPRNFGFRNIRPLIPFSLQPGSTQVLIVVTSLVGVVYGVEYAANLISSDWTLLESRTTTNTPTVFHDNSAGLSAVTTRFYRVFLLKD